MSKSHRGRREFIKKLSVGSLASLAFVKKAKAKTASLSQNSLDLSKNHPYSILQSASSSLATTLVVVAPQEGLITFEVREVGSEYRPPMRVRDVSLYSMEDRVFHLEITELNMDKEYKLLCYEGSTLKDQRSFRGLQNQHQRFAALSCSNQSVANPQREIWSCVLNEEVDALFYLGDSVYANSPWDTAFWRVTPPEKAYERYIQTFKTIPLYKAERLIPVFNIWDDHDYASNNGDRHHPHKAKMQEIFRIFFPLLHGPELHKGPGVSFGITFGGCRYYFIDNRSFRDYSAATNAHFGEEQKEWLLNSLNANPQPSVFVMGGQIYGFGWNRDSMDNQHPEDLEWLQNLTRSFRYPITFITGDIHFSHVQKIPARDFGYLNYEFTSSAMHSYSTPGWGRRSPRSGQLHYCGWSNYNVFEISPRNESLQVKVICKDSTNFIQYQNVFTIRTDQTGSS